jgi:hypothetical protein
LIPSQNKEPKNSQIDQLILEESDVESSKKDDVETLTKILTGNISQANSKDKKRPFNEISNKQTSPKETI